jgi:hypothetical protein
VHWIGGGVDVLETVDADQVITIHEGASKGSLVLPSAERLATRSK